MDLPFFKYIVIKIYIIIAINISIEIPPFLVYILSIRVNLF